MAYRFAHCTDIHLLCWGDARPWSFFNKRVTGGLNLLVNRRKRHHDGIFTQMQAALAELELDRLVVTGDLTNLSFDAEFRRVQEVLASLPVPVTVIPGNHDAYTRSAYEKRSFERILGAFMAGEREPDHDYPFLLRDGPVAFLGLSSAVPTPFFSARGLVGTDQLARLEKMLEGLAGESLTRVLLVHHPITLGVAKAGHELVDDKALRDVLCRHGVELVLHGHEHRWVREQINVPVRGGAGASSPGVAEVWGLPSGTCRAISGPRQAGFVVHELSTPGGMPREQVMVWNGTHFEPGEPFVR